jgi:geranylgeranyl reductase family protein
LLVCSSLAVMKQAHQYLSHLQQSVSRLSPKQIAVGGAVGVSVLLGVFVLKKFMGPSSKPIKYDDAAVLQSENYYDVAIVGAGPSGSTTAFYLRRHGIKVLLLERKKFPRDKYCGDAVSFVAQKYLKEMGVFDELQREKLIRMSRVGGIVSPKGYSFISNSAEELKLGEIGVMAAVKRIHLDEKIARAAQREGAVLVENSFVTDAKFDEKSGTWEVFVVDDKEKDAESGPGTATRTYRARVLVCADGAPSALARKLGIVKEPPNSVCSRQYIKKGTHNFKDIDGVCFYPKSLLPGYSAIFAEADGDVNYLCYIIPGGQFNENDLASVHETLAKNDPNISKILGDAPVAETMKGAPLRLGGVKKSFARHLLIVGDAAGLIDPLTGEGIHLAMHSGKLAADVLAECFKHQNFSEGYMKKYQDKWMKDMGHEFYWSAKMSRLLYRFPQMLDAAALVIRRKGGSFLADWALVMSGQKSKLWFVRPDVCLPLIWELIRESIRGDYKKQELIV